QTLTVNKAAQSIAFPALTAKTLGATDFAPEASATSGLAVAYTSSDTTVATVVSGQIHLVGAGTASLIASQAGDANYLSAADVPQTLLVRPAPPKPLDIARIPTFSGAGTGTTVQLTWPQADLATGYRVQVFLDTARAPRIDTTVID